MANYWLVIYIFFELFWNVKLEGTFGGIPHTKWLCNWYSILKNKKTTWETVIICNNWVFDYVITMILYQNWAFDFFLMITVINFDTWLDIRWGFGAIFNTRPTLVYVRNKCDEAVASFPSGVSSSNGFNTIKMNDSTHGFCHGLIRKTGCHESPLSQIG
jgi:hypothetical protein